MAAPLKIYPLAHKLCPYILQKKRPRGMIYFVTTIFSRRAAYNSSKDF